jgi:hypothetical protein
MENIPASYVKAKVVVFANIVLVRNLRLGMIQQSLKKRRKDQKNIWIFWFGLIELVMLKYNLDDITFY